MVEQVRAGDRLPAWRARYSRTANSRAVSAMGTPARATACVDGSTTRSPTSRRTGRCAGAAEIMVEAELRAKLERSRRTGTPLKVKLGTRSRPRPTCTWATPWCSRSCATSRTSGHQVIIIIGDFTGMIGDPTGRSETRRPLTWDEIRAERGDLQGPARQGARHGADPGAVQLASGSARSSFEQIIRETAHLTVARILQREDFATRYAAGRPISLHEFLYPLAQGYDSVALGADVELGGTDQTFNLLVGRDLQRAHGQEPQVALTRADPRGARRRAEDVEEPRQLRGHHRAGRRHVRQAHVGLGRADVPLLRAGDPRAGGRRSPRSAACTRWRPRSGSPGP